MVDQSKRFDLGKTAPVTPGDKGDAQAVKTRRNSRQSENLIDTTVLLCAKLARSRNPILRQFLQSWAQSIVNGDSKVLPWIILAALSVTQPNSAACQVDIFHWNRALGKPASGVESDFKASPHPFGLICEFSPDRGNIIVSQLGFDLLRRPRNAETSNRIRFGELAPDRFIDELGEEFDLKQSGIVSNLSTMNLGRQSPANVRPAMSVSDLPRVDDALLIQERFNGLPSDRVTPSGISRALPVGCDVTRNPGSESRGTGRPANPLFFDRSFISQSLSFSGVSGVVDSQAGGFLDPQTGVEIAFAEIPERGTFFSDQMCHWSRIGHRRTKVKWFVVDYPPCSEVWPWAGECWEFLPLHYEASLSPVEKSRVGQESDILGYFLSCENTGNPRFGKKGA